MAEVRPSADGIGLFALRGLPRGLDVCWRDELAQRARQAAREVGLSQSQWIANLIREGTRSDWPESVRALAGAWADFPLAEALRADAAADVEREAL